MAALRCTANSPLSSLVTCRHQKLSRMKIVCYVLACRPTASGILTVSRALPTLRSLFDFLLSSLDISCLYTASDHDHLLSTPQSQQARTKMQLKLFYSFIVLLLAWLGQGLHPTYLASTALLSALYFGALVLPGHLHFALLFQLLPLAAGRLLASVSALKLLPGIQGALVGLPVALLLAIPPVLAVHVAKINRSTIVFVRLTQPCFCCFLFLAKSKADGRVIGRP